MKECTLLRQVLRYCQEQSDIFVYKTHGSPRTRKGMPDLFGNVGMIAFYVELKVGDRKMSSIQETVSHKILLSGAQFMVVYTLDQFIAFVTHLTNLNRKLDRPDSPR